MIYFSANSLQFLPKKEQIRLFDYCLLLFEKIYVICDPHDIEWSIMDKNIGVKNFQMPAEHYKNIGDQFPAEIKKSQYVKPLFHYSPVIYENLKLHVDSVLNISEISSLTKELYYFAKNDNIPSFQLEIRCFEILKEMKSKIDHQDIIQIRDMINDFFIAAHLAQKYNIPSMFAAGEIRFMKKILNGKNFNLWDINSSLKSRYKFYTGQGLIRKIYDLSVDPKTMGEIILPDLSDIPIIEISKFISKDKHKPITYQLEQMLDKYNNKITEKDVLTEMMYLYKKVSNTLSPSVGDIAIAVLGNLPTPTIINPIGVYDAGKTIKEYFDLKKDYPFIFAVQSLTKLNKKRKFENIFSKFLFWKKESKQK